MDFYPNLRAPESLMLRKSSVHGHGVFATRDIFRGELIEECPYLLLNSSYAEVDAGIKYYVYNVQSLSVTEERPLLNYPAICLGYGAMYNHHNEKENVKYRHFLDKKIFAFYTTKPVKFGEELFVNYGPNYDYAQAGFPRISENEVFNKNVKKMLDLVYSSVYHLLITIK